MSAMAVRLFSDAYIVSSYQKRLDDGNTKIITVVGARCRNIFPETN